MLWEYFLAREKAMTFTSIAKKLVSLYQALSNVMVIDHQPVVHKLVLFSNQ